MRAFQDEGHKAVFIVGDYTTRIGDPSGRSSERPILSDEEIDANAQRYLEQAKTILRGDPELLEVYQESPNSAEKFLAHHARAMLDLRRAHQHMLQSLEAIDYSDQKVLMVDNPDALKGHEGHHIAVTGHVKGDSIHVESAKML